MNGRTSLLILRGRLVARVQRKHTNIGVIVNLFLLFYSALAAVANSSDETSTGQTTPALTTTMEKTTTITSSEITISLCIKTVDFMRRLVIDRRRS